MRKRVVPVWDAHCAPDSVAWRRVAERAWHGFVGPRIEAPGRPLDRGISDRRRRQGPAEALSSGLEVEANGKDRLGHVRSGATWSLLTVPPAPGGQRPPPPLADAIAPEPAVHDRHPVRRSWPGDVAGASGRVRDSQLHLALHLVRQGAFLRQAGPSRRRIALLVPADRVRNRSAAAPGALRRAARSHGRLADRAHRRRGSSRHSRLRQVPFSARVVKAEHA